jgi:hypothetical protein
MYEYIPATYESMMGFGLGTNGNGAEPVAVTVPGLQLEDQAFVDQGVVGPAPQVENGTRALAIGAGVGALALLLLGIVVIGIAMPFALGAAGAAITGAKGYKKEAAKKGAIYGGLAGIGAGIVLTIISAGLESVSQGSGRYVGGSGLVPFAVGLYIGYKHKERLREEGAIS